MVQTYKKMKTKMKRAQNAAQRQTFFTFEAKKLLELSSAKLAALSIGLLLAVFCTIGMSFTPATEDNVVDPNDSTYIAGPRRSHYFKSGTCSDTNHYEKDYAKATASTAGNGYVTLSSPSGGGLVTNPASYANGTTLTSGSNSGASVSISWNCNHKETSNGGATATAAMHTRKFTIKAFPNENYYFKGWSTSTSENDIFGNANPYTFDQTIDDWNQNNGSHETENKALTTTYYAIFKPEVIANLTFAVPEHGSYTFSTEDVSATTVSSSTGEKQLTTKKAVTLTATPASGYKFFGWYKNSDSPANYLGYTSPLTLGFEKDATIYAKFIKSDAALFEIKGGDGTTYYDLNDACTAALNSSSKVVVPTANGTLYAGTYTIPSGVTLLVPYESSYKYYTSPTTNYEKIQEFSSATQYVLLTLSSGVNISLSGNLIVMADLCAPVGGGAGSGAPLSAYGRIAMLENSTITVNSGANLYCWGYITGIEGLVTAKSGAKIHEIFQHQNNPGGSAASGWNEEAFFLNQYYVQNIESPLKIEYGAIETVYAQMTVPSSTINNLSASLIGKDDVGMFALTSSGSYLIRTYDPFTDRITYDIYGNVKLNYISMSVYGMDLNTSKYVLPITSNMSVKCHTLNGNASTFNIQYAVSFIPGAELFADEGVTLNIRNKLIIYDRDEWIGKNFAQFNKYSGGYNWTRSSFTPTRTYIRVNADLVDAKVDLNGTMNVSGSLYTTNSGAAIISSNGTGVVKLSSAAPGNSNDIQYSANKLGASIKVPMTPAQLHNSNAFKNTYGVAFEYLATSGAAANTTITYANGHWGWVGTWKNEDGSVIKNANTCTEATLLEKQKPADPTKTSTAKFTYTFKDWVVDEDNSNRANQELVYIPTFDQTINKYTITWVDGDGKILKTEQIEYGSTPSYSGDTPQKSSTVDKVFTFKNTWSPSITTVSDDAIYTAQFNESPHEYNITWVDGDGKTLKTEQIEYGSTPSYTGETPQKSSTVDKVFTFNNTWSPSITTVSGDVTYTAQFNESTREYTVTWKDMDATFTQEQQVVKTEQIKYGARPEYNDEYKKPDRNGMTFDVFGWSNGTNQYKKVGDDLPKLPIVEGNVTYTALYNALVEHKQVSEPESLDVDINAATTTIHTGGRLTIPASKTLTTTDFVLEATAEASGELIGDVAADNIYFDLIIGDTESRHWHAFTVPFVVNLKKEGKPIQINGETLTLGRGYDIVYYNGAERAANGKSAKCWKYVEEEGDSILHPGKAYMIASASRAIDVVRFTKYDDEETRISVSKNASSTGVDNDGGWNGIGNPKMYHAVLEETGATVCQVHDGGRIGADGYNMYDLTGKLVVGKAVYVQVKEKNDDVSVVAATGQDIIRPKTSSAPSKNKTDRMSGRYDVHIAPADGEMADHIYLLADEEKEDRYVILADLAKAGVSPVRAQMWVDRYDDRLCMNTAVLVNNQADYPLGISVPNAGEYDIYIAAQPEEDAVMYLTLDGKPVWNLSYGGYTATLEKGTTNRYGLRLVKKSSKVPTGMEELTIENGGAVRKVLVNDKVYIIRNGETYTITGQMVK